MPKTIEELRLDGYQRGKMIAAWVDVPEKNKPFFGHPITDCESARAAMFKVAVKAEANNREFAAFEPTRHELNSHPDRDAAWSSYAEGVMQGIREQVDAALRAAGKYRWEQ
jgi:hypothetical protein